MMGFNTFVEGMRYKFTYTRADSTKSISGYVDSQTEDFIFIRKYYRGDYVRVDKRDIIKVKHCNKKYGGVVYELSDTD